MIVEALFWVSVASVLYPYFGYPLALRLLRPLARRPLKQRPGYELPSVSMIIPVFNESVRIDRKVANTIALQYPADRLEVLFVSDGSTDGTAERIRAANVPQISVIELDRRRGKAAASMPGSREPAMTSWCFPTPRSNCSRRRSND